MNDLNDHHAQKIYQGLLDDIGSAIAERDIDRFVTYFAVPHRVETFETTLILEDDMATRGFFEDMVARLGRINVTGLVRHCTIAEFVDPETIRGCHETRLVDTRLRIVEEYMALSQLRCFDGVWRVTDGKYAEAAPSLPTRISRRQMRAWETETTRQVAGR